ncbi:3-oxoacyl-ACP synthase III family protein [Kitasatospora sp. NPDC059327]|uniref:3-oxoacyl-ACP synthase III family protein n=1 Tax=Kitasatospora sp. NPDC059327 TaxID=3346803 RepID=UPI003682F084
MNVGILGVGAHVPENVVSNSDLEELTGLTDTWVREKTGIEQRRHCATGEPVADMALHALMDACRRSGIDPGEIDALVTSTSTPAGVMPGLGVRLIADAGLNLAMTPVDVVGAGCAGAVGLLHLGARLVEAGVGTVAVVQSEASSSLMRLHDVRRGEALPTTIFGDGACCWLLRPCRDGTGILFNATRTDPAGNEGLALHGTDIHSFAMDPRAVKRFALREVPALLGRLEEGSGTPVAAADLILLHQANLRLIEGVLDILDVPISRTCTTVQDYGNTISASVGITAARAIDAGLLAPGALVFLAAFGAGWTTNGTVVRWCAPADFVR